MLKTTISVASLSVLSATPAFANAITADSKVWTNEGSTVEIGASYRQLNVDYVKPVQKVREVHIPSVPAYEYTDAHGRVVCVPEVPGYTYHETYTAYDRATKTVSKTQGNTKVSTRLSDDLAISLGIDGSVYGGAAIKNGSAVISGTINTQGHYNATLAISPFKNTALIANLNKDFTSYGIQQQIGQGSVLVAYAPSNRGIMVGFGMELGAAPVIKETPVIKKTTVIKETPVVKETTVIKETPVVTQNPVITQTPVVKPQPATLPNLKFIPGRG